MDRLLNVKREKRQRYLKLAEIANKICNLLEDEGVEQNEGCLVRQLAERMWDGGAHVGLENALREPTAHIGTATVSGGNECCEVDRSC